MNKRKILICGITGSIGMQAIDVIKENEYELVGFSFNKNIELANRVLIDFPNVFVYSPSNKELNNVESFDELILKSKPDIILNAVVGFAGLEISIKSIIFNIDLALANKESMVTAGWLIKELLKSRNCKIYPVDSEHSSIYDILVNSNKKIEKIILTASGGPFFDKDVKEYENATFEDAIKHPNWSMGYKISIDSATLMNKCFEIIEGYYLFNTNMIEAVRHKNSIVHGIVQFKDNSYFANFSEPNMKLAIQLGLSKFKSNKKIISGLDLNNLSIEFDKIDTNKWLPIKWAYEFLSTKNRVLPIILNSANEELIEMFRENKIDFSDITNKIKKSIIEFKDLKIKNLKDIYIVDKLVREYVRKD